MWIISSEEKSFVVSGLLLVVGRRRRRRRRVFIIEKMIRVCERIVLPPLKAVGTMHCFFFLNKSPWERGKHKDGFVRFSCYSY
jgi:hypothetical protein